MKRVQQRKIATVRLGDTRRKNAMNESEQRKGGVGLKETDAHCYDDIIEMPHHQSATRPHMSNHDRAAQFAPFAALTGYDAAVKETARLTEEKLELDDSEKAILNKKLQIIRENMGGDAEVTITYFMPDEKKTGGSYISYTGCVRKIDAYGAILIMTDKTRIPIEQIREIEGECFPDLELD